MTLRAAERARDLEGEPEISVSRGLRDDGSGGIDAWTDSGTFVDRTLEPEHRATHIAYRGEPSHKRCFSLPGRQHMKVGGVGGHEDRLGCRGHESMPMRIDETRHQHAALTLDDRDVFDSA